MGKVTFNEAVCKECRLCTTVCPQKIITISDRMNAKGYHPATVADMSKCTACAACARVCPDCVITVER